MKDKDVKSIDFLWYLFLNGDDKVFAAIYHHYIERLLSYGYKFSSDRELVHDSIQEIFIELFLKRKKVGNDIKNLNAYLFTAFRNGLLKKIKKLRKYEPIDLIRDKDNQYFTSEYNIQNQLIETELSNTLKKKLSIAVNKLPSKQKEIIYLKFDEEMSYAEISAIMNISIESSRKLLYRALLSLRKVFEKQRVEALLLFFFKKR